MSSSASTYRWSYEYLEAFVRDKKLPGALDEPARPSQGHERSPRETWKKELNKKIKELQATRDRRVENISKESKKKASEKEKTKEERQNDVRAKAEADRREDEQALRDVGAASQPSTRRCPTRSAPPRKEELKARVDDMLAKWDDRLDEIEKALDIEPGKAGGESEARRRRLRPADTQARGEDGRARGQTRREEDPRAGGVRQARQRTRDGASTS